MKVRSFDPEKDYPLVKSWWEAQKLAPIPKHALPGIGYVAYNEDMDVAVGWMDMSLFGIMCYFYGFLANDAAPPTRIIEAHDTIMDIMEFYAKGEGYSVIVNTPHQLSLKKLAIKKGYLENHPSVSQLFKILRLKEDPA